MSKEDIDISMWSEETQAQIRKTLKMGEELMKMLEKIRSKND